MTNTLIAVAGLMIAGLLSPGPNFVLISARALSSGSRSASAAALGVSGGSITHAIFGVAGFGALLQSSTGLFTIAKMIGASYLVWIGFKSVRGAIRAKGVAVGNDVAGSSGVGVRRSVVDGYLTQMSNPKSTLFFLAMFTTVVPTDITIWQGTAVVATVGATALAGYVLIATALSQPIFQRAYRRVGSVFDAIFGVAMIALGLRVALAES